MSSTISIPVLKEDDDYVTYFENMVDDPEHDFNQALNIDPLSVNMRAIVDSVQIDSVKFDKGLDIHVEYTVSYSWYYGCDDANGADDITDIAVGKRVLDMWIFDKSIRTEEPNDSME